MNTNSATKLKKPVAAATQLTASVSVSALNNNNAHRSSVKNLGASNCTRPKQANLSAEELRQLQKFMTKYGQSMNRVETDIAEKRKALMNHKSSQ